MTLKRWMLVVMVVAMVIAPVRGQSPNWYNIKGTVNSSLKIGPPVSALTLTNSSGVLSLSGGLTTNGGGVATLGAVSASGVITSTYNAVGAPMVIADTDKVVNLQADSVDGFHFGLGSAGGVTYQASSSNITSSAAGTAGQILVSGGTGAPTWLGLTSANIFVGNGSNVPTGVAMTGDITISNAGVTAVGSSKITSAMIVDATIATGDMATSSVNTNAILDGTITVDDMASNSVATGHIVNATILGEDLGSNCVTTLKILDGTIAFADLGSSIITFSNLVNAVNVLLPTATSSVTSESLDLIRCTIQLKEGNGSTNLSKQVQVLVNISDTNLDMENVSTRSITLGTGVGDMYYTPVANKKLICVTSATGVLQVDVTLTGAFTVYCVFSIGANTYSQVMTFI